MVKRVVLLGAYGQRNLGDDALLAVFVKRLHGTSIVANSARPAETSAEHQITALPNRILPSIADMTRSIMRADHVVFGGGSLLKDLEGSWIIQHLYNARLGATLLLCRIARVPSSMVAIGCGPMRKPSTRIIARLATRLVTTISVRDAASAELLRSIGVKRAIPVSADPVLAWPNPPDQMPTAETPPVAAVIPRYSLTPEQEQIFARLCDRWIERTAGMIQLIPFQTGFMDAYDDRASCERIRAAMARADRAIICTPTKPQEAIDLLARTHLVISVRLHALIFGALAGVPMVAFSYDPKVAAFMQSIGQGDAVTDITSTSHETAEHLIDRVWYDRPARRQAILERAGQLKEKAEQDFAQFTARFGYPSAPD